MHRSIDLLDGLIDLFEGGWEKWRTDPDENFPDEIEGISKIASATCPIAVHVKFFPNTRAITPLEFRRQAHAWMRDQSFYPATTSFNK